MSELLSLPLPSCWSASLYAQRDKRVRHRLLQHFPAVQRQTEQCSEWKQHNTETSRCQPTTEGVKRQLILVLDEQQLSRLSHAGMKTLRLERNKRRARFFVVEQTEWMAMKRRRNWLECVVLL
ncbi:hypothetical protein INR49_011311 [Caranx melampygus]|nr:hypothetical protein INR49_011311 [Caranx melampygus]